MRSKPWLQEAPLAACCVLAFCIPFPFIYATLSIWLLAACWLISGRYKETWLALKQTKAYWLWAAYFAMHAISYAYSQNKWQSQFDTVGKLSFLLMPILAGAGTAINLRGLSAIVLSFILGVVVTGGFCVIQAYMFWHHDGILRHFFYHELTRGLDANAVYMAWYVVVALSGLLLFPWREAGMSWMIRARWPAVIIGAVFLILLASRLLLLIFLLVVIPAYCIRYFRLRKRSLAIPVLAILIAFGSLAILARTKNPIHERFSDIMHPDVSSVLKDNYYGTEPGWTNLTLRLFIWRMAIENMQVHNLWLKGAGNGDVHRIQNERIAAHGIVGLDDSGKEHSILYNVNLHNMYLQSLVMLGLPGLCVFMLIVAGPLFYLRRSSTSYFFTLFHFTAVWFMLQESALQTQAGVVFYAFFSAVLWQSVKRDSKPANLLIAKR